MSKLVLILINCTFKTLEITGTNKVLSSFYSFDSMQKAPFLLNIFEIVCVA